MSAVLQRIVKQINPKFIIPIHTESANKYTDYFGKDIIRLEDGVVFSL